MKALAWHGKHDVRIDTADDPDIAMSLYGQEMSGLFGYSHMTGGYAGGQAEYVRVPFSDVGPIVVPEGVDDDKVLFLSDILPTGWQVAEYAQIEPGDTVAVRGCGPVGLFAVQSAIANVTPNAVLAEQHRNMAEPGTAKN